MTVSEFDLVSADGMPPGFPRKLTDAELDDLLEQMMEHAQVTDVRFTRQLPELQLAVIQAGLLEQQRRAMRSSIETAQGDARRAVEAAQEDARRSRWWNALVRRRSPGGGRGGAGDRRD